MDPDASPSFRRRILGSAVAAGVAAVVVHLLQRFVFHHDEGWGDSVVRFVVLFLGHLALPSILPPLRRFFQGPEEP
jgi:hypothetical protein